MDKNISTLLREIKDATDWSEPRIASELRVSQPTVNRILHGQGDCKASTFRAIVELHKSLHSDGALAESSPPIEEVSP